jgi:ankyrin repeat protein
MSNQGGSKAIGSPLMTIKNELLHGAVVRGELPTVRRLLDRHRADINTKNSNGIGCLQLAILNGHTKLAEFLIQKGIDIHLVDPEGYTALHDAALEENAVLVHKLISKGVSPLVATNMGELPIDLAGSFKMEKMLCEEMYQSGEVQLARQYYVYFGLEQRELENGEKGRPLIIHPHPPRSHPKPAGCKSTLIAHASSSPKLENKNSSALQTDSQVSKNLPTHASRVHPSANSSEDCLPNDLLVSGQSFLKAPKAGNLPNSTPGSTGNHKNVGGMSQDAYKDLLRDEEATDSATTQRFSGKEVHFTTKEDSDSVCGDNPPASSDQPFTTHLKPDSKPTGELISPTHCEFNRNRRNLSPQQARASAAIKALHQHSSFQLQIGLSLQSGQFSTLDEEDSSATDKNSSSPQENSNSSSSSSDLSITDSPVPVSRNKHHAQLQSDWFLTAEVHQHRKKATHTAVASPRSRRNQRLLQKSVSFADFHMTRSKPMFVGQSSNQGSGSPTSTPEKKERSGRTGLGHSLSFSTNVLDRYISNYNPGRAKDGAEASSMFDAGIRALGLKPVKSSIMRRHNSEGGLQRRRSVTFQPEVLLQEIVTDGDVKAVNEILESGMIEDVNKMSPSGLTALHQSAIDGKLDCAQTLVAKGADVNCTDCENWTPLHAAVMNGSMEFVRFLLASGAKPTLKNDSGETAYDMAKSGPIRKMLLNAMNGRSPDADEFSDGEYSGEEEEEEYSHAETESDDDELEGDGSALFDSNVGEKTSLKERLGLTHTAALNNAHSNSVTPSPDLDNVFSGSSQIYQRREHELTDSTSSYGSLFEQEEKLKNKVDVRNTSNRIMNTESDTDKISESGISTMEGSSDGSHSHRSRVLSSEDEAITLDSDLDPDSIEYEFQESCLYCDVDRVMKLVRFRQDLDVNRVNKTSGITALHHSVLEENFALVQHLVKDFEADLHVQDIEGWTPLHAASAVGNIQIAQFLLDRGAKPSSLNLNCEFPVDVAEDEAMEKLLKKAMLGHSAEKGLMR